MWDHSKLLEAMAAEISHASRISAEYTIGDTRMKADMLALPLLEDDWFWVQFGVTMRPHQLCAALLSANAPEAGGWRYAGLQLVLSAAARQARPGAGHGYTLRALAILGL